MPTLHLLCGKIASGKSTLAQTLAAQHGAIVFSEDHWLATLYPAEIRSIADYLRCAQRVRGVLGPLVIKVLQSGVNVVLDFPANTLANREWLLEARLVESLANSAQDDSGRLSNLSDELNGLVGRFKS
jgi:predicted kinase